MVGGLKVLGTREIVLIHVFNIRDVGTLVHTLMELARPVFEKQKKALEDAGFRVEADMVLGLPHIEITRLAEERDCSLIVVGCRNPALADELVLGSVACAVVHRSTCPVLLPCPGTMPEKGGAVPGEGAWDPLRHVLYPTDFSDNAERAFAYVRETAECGAKRITLLHVQDKGRIDPHLKERLEEFNRIDTERLQRLKAELEKHGAPEVRIELPYGSPKKEIIDRTRRGEVSLVVLGRHGRGHLAELFLGSVSHAVIRHSGAPVLLVPAMP